MFLFLTLQATNVDYYINQADKQKLSQSRYWHLLLHMPSTDSESEIDDKNFFFAPDGYENPKAELDATLYALYHETALDDNATACKFPARLFWLQKELHLENLPEVHCATFDNLVKRMDPQAVSLVFPSAHVNSPASMFGHTFLRIDSSYDSKMLSYAINYAADADPTKENGMLFAVKGLVGGYYGTYSLLPYYEKLKEYRDSDQRDIWEYDLDLKPDEVMQMVRHIWELKDTYSWYYFFDENCSYNMLWFIEIARPSIHLREDFTYFVIPPETVHSIYKSGIVKELHYRPSKRTTLLAYEDVLDVQGREDALLMAQGKIDVSTYIDSNKTKVQQKRYTLEAASELNQYNYMSGDLSKENYLAYSREILTARAHLGKGELIKIKEPYNPLEGHQATRVVAESGWRNGTPVQFLGWRPANHDIYDSDVGYMRGTQIEFLDVLLRYEEGAVNLEKLTLLSIVSIAPRSDFFEHFSWRMKSGFDTDYLDKNSNFMTSIGGGYSWGNEYGYLYFMVDPLFYVESEFVAGIGGSVGLVTYESKMFKTNIEGTYRAYDTGKQQASVIVSQNIRFYNDLALKLSYKYMQKDASITQEEWNTFKLSLDYFF